MGVRRINQMIAIILPRRTAMHREATEAGAQTSKSRPVMGLTGCHLDPLACAAYPSTGKQIDTFGVVAAARDDGPNDDTRSPWTEVRWLGSCLSR